MTSQNQPKTPEEIVELIVFRLRKEFHDGVQLGDIMEIIKPIIHSYGQQERNRALEEAAKVARICKTMKIRASNTAKEHDMERIVALRESDADTAFEIERGIQALITKQEKEE